MKEAHDNWMQRLRYRCRRTAEQKGVTLQEVLIGVAVAAVVAAGAIFLGPRFIGQGQQSAGQTTLNVAVSAVNSTYATIASGGQQTWAGRTGSQVTATTDVAATSEAAVANAWTAAAVYAFNRLGESVEFIPALTTCATDIAAPVSGITNYFTAATDECIDAINEINSLDANTIWVKVYDSIQTDDNAGAGSGNDVNLLAGKALVLGSRSADGSTQCAVVVKSSAPSSGADSLLGTGYQAVDENISIQSATGGSVGAAAVVGGHVADCGAFEPTLDDKAWPGVDTDLNLSSPRDNPYY